MPRICAPACFCDSAFLRAADAAPLNWSRWKAVARECWCVQVVLRFRREIVEEVGALALRVDIDARTGGMA